MTPAVEPSRRGSKGCPPCGSKCSVQAASVVAFLAGAAAAVALVVLVPMQGPLGVPDLLKIRAGCAQSAGSFADAPPRVSPYVGRHRSYTPVLPPDALRRGMVYSGSGRRMQRFAAKLLDGQPVKVVTFGGSVTMGAGATSPERAYPSRFGAWINATFPHADHVLANRGIGGTSSGIFAVCAEKMLPADAKDPDMVVLEFTFNEQSNLPIDSPRLKGFEQLLRRLLRLPSRPAVVVLHYYSWWYAKPLGRDGAKGKGYAGDPGDGGFFWEGAEMQLSQFAQYYDCPSASLRSAAYHLMRSNAGNFNVSVLKPAPHLGFGPKLPGTPGQAFYADVIHPADFGHQALADLLNELTWQAVAELDRDRQQAAAERRMALSLLNGGRVLARRLVRADSSGGSGSSGERQAEAQLKVSSIGGGSSGSDNGGGAGSADGTGSEPASGPTTGASAAADGGAGQQVVPEPQLQGAAPAAAAAAAALQQEEEEEAELPPPMVRGTADIAPSTCFLQEEFKGVVAATSGFSWVPARPNAASFNAQKWAWTGTEPGAWVELAIDSREDASSSDPSSTETVFPTVILGYLKSYESMGSAKVECVAGCDCWESMIDGTWERPATLMQMHAFMVTQHPDCRIRVTILPQTKSGQHKISLTFLMASAYDVVDIDAYDSQAQSIVTGSAFGS